MNLFDIFESEGEYILYFDGKPVAKYDSVYDAEFQARLVKKKVPDLNFEIKKEVCTYQPVQLKENLRDWFKDKWVRFGPDGKIRGDCARGDDSEGKPKCLPQSKAHALGKKGRAQAAARKRREDPNPERSGAAINVNTKKKSNEGVAEGQQMGEYNRVLTALRLYYPDKLSMEELNTPDWHRVIANKANVPIEYAGQVINDFTLPISRNDDDYYYDDEQGVAEGLEGRVVFSGTGANGAKYEIIQSSPTDFMIHANGKHIDTYSSLQRAMSVLKNEVSGLTKGVAEAVNTKVFQRPFRQEQQYGAYTLVATPGRFLLHQKPTEPSEQFRIEAKYRGHTVAWVNFENIDGHLEALDLSVDAKHRRKGIATAMYQFAKRLGNDIAPSTKQTALGQKFWKEKSPVRDIAEATGDPKFDKMLKGITAKRAVTKQQKADTKQRARDAFNGMFGGGNPADKLTIRKKGVAEGTLNEFDPGEGGFGPFKLYKGSPHHYDHIDTFSSLNAAEEEMEFQKDMAAQEGSIDYYKIIDGTGEEVGGFDPDNAYDDMRRGSKIQNRKPGEQGVAEGLNKKAKARKEAEAVMTVIKRLEAELKDPNPHLDKADIQRRLDNEKRRLELYRDVLDEQGVAEEKCPHCSGPMFSELMINEKKDACYYKVKSRYKVWPSAYASGALVKCRKKGAANWGNKSEGLINEFSSTGGSDGDILKTLAYNWVAGDTMSGDLKSDIASQEEVERRLQRGVICPDGVTRKLNIDWNEDYDGVVIFDNSDDWSIQYNIDRDLSESSVNDYFKRRKDEEDRIAGTKPPAKRKPQQTDYQKKRKEQNVTEVFQNDEANLFYRYDPTDGRLKQRMVSNYDERQAFAQGFKHTPEQALRVHGIIRSKFNPTKWVQKQGNRWVEVFPYGQQGIKETAEYSYRNINDDDWYEFDSEGNVVRQSGPRRYEFPFGPDKTIKLPNGNIAAKGMTAKRLKLFKNLSESREYYNVTGTDSKSLRQDFNMSKDRLGWFLKEGSTPKHKLDAIRAFGSPKLKEYDLSSFSGGTQTKGEDNVISPVGSQTRAQYKK